MQSVLATPTKIIKPFRALKQWACAALCSFGLIESVFAGPSLTLDQLIGIGLNENAYILASRDQVAAAKGDATIARRFLG